MARSDYLRPSENQIRHHYKCDSCRRETEYFSDQDMSRSKCACGGNLSFSGESYPADQNEWDEERDHNGEWRRR